MKQREKELIKERPLPVHQILIPGILRGEKVQTRRVVKGLPEHAKNVQVLVTEKLEFAFEYPYEEATCYEILRCPHGKIGDRLWVKETFRGVRTETMQICQYRADSQEPCTLFPDNKWKSSMHMPRWASRILLEIVNLRVERLQDISEEDAISEGVEHLFSEKEIEQDPRLASSNSGWKNYLWHGRHGSYGLGNKKSNAWPHQYSNYSSAKDSFSSLWEFLSGPGSWDANPLVWVIEFKVIPNALE